MSSQDEHEEYYDEEEDEYEEEYEDEEESPSPQPGPCNASPAAKEHWGRSRQQRQQQLLCTQHASMIACQSRTGPQHT
jgi:hypothetical protein